MTTKAALLSAIRANCLDCCGGMPSEVARCGIISCPLRDYRAGRDPRPARSGPVMPFGKIARPGGAVLAEAGPTGTHNRPHGPRATVGVARHAPEIERKPDP
jgi:hypothetical protein